MSYAEALAAVLALPPEVCGTCELEREAIDIVAVDESGRTVCVECAVCVHGAKLTEPCELCPEG